MKSHTSDLTMSVPARMDLVNIAVITLLAAAFGFCAACGAVGPTPIRAILDDPRKYDGNIVTISGEVQDSTNLVVLKWYRVADETGSIVVVASGAVPRRGAKVHVTGRVRQAFAIGEESLTVIMEGD